MKKLTDFGKDVSNEKQLLAATIFQSKGHKDDRDRYWCDGKEGGKTALRENKGKKICWFPSFVWDEVTHSVIIWLVCYSEK